MEDIVINVTCPKCANEFDKKAKDMKDGTIVSCPKCGDKTTIKGNMFTDMQKNLDRSS
ncbi:MAG: hypothetical protein AABY45_00925 [Deltaproteobacteria bacterium]